MFSSERSSERERERARNSKLRITLTVAMGKKRSVIVLSSSSSSSEDNARPSAASRRRSRGSSSASFSSGTKKPRRRSVAPTRDPISKRDSRKDMKAEFDMLSEDFSECLGDISMSGPLCHPKELWVEKYKPRSLSDLAVHKKKVEEVKNWLEERLKVSKEGLRDHILLLTGQAGTGKSAVIHAVASEVGAELCEWKTPTPTLWSEHLHNSNSGLQYVSKLEEFESFVETIRKYSLLSPTDTDESKKPVIVLIDDVPITNGKVGLARLSRCLMRLTHCTKVPIVILITQCHKTDSGDGSSWYWEELEALIERAGAHKVMFNPITLNSMKKALLKITKEEKCEVSVGSIEDIAKASMGDIRNAITSLQYYCLNLQNLCGTQQVVNSSSYSFGRDETLSLFHALGKFLHNKRETIADTELQDPPPFTLKERYIRKPMKMKMPELVLSQAYGQARSVADFLHENVLDFIEYDSVFDSWVVSSYLSEADCLLASGIKGIPSRRAVYEITESEGLAHIIAASVSVRGVLFGNSQPAGSRWHSIRSPRIWKIEQSIRHSKDVMVREIHEISETFGLLSLSDLATEFRPIMQKLGIQYLESSGHATKSQIHCPTLSNQFSAKLLESERPDSDEVAEDEIEDW
ncbi:Replication factor C large subunit [Rhynchospora pubera]|uniref:Replication factor C large subunit n=1 Tax=Rhynchospora pubera TaxID=906938 RepID=A0AAV8EL74_9POAL|nr:Replication factor C large subunit [Rhynchospora pubera]